MSALSFDFSEWKGFFMRLDAYLCRGGYSRREAQKMIKIKSVTVNGIVQNQPSFPVKDGDSVFAAGEEVWGQKWIYLVLNKPAGYICTTDPGAQCVLNLIPKKYRIKGISPVGRLDKETTGLLFLSNDGQLIHHMISPGKHLSKEYAALLRDPLTEEQAGRISSGLTLADGTVCRPAEVTGLGEKQVSIVLTEGKYHQVRRMFAAVGNYVCELRRTRVGNFCLAELKEGECRLLSEDMVRGIFE